MRMQTHVLFGTGLITGLCGVASATDPHPVDFQLRPAGDGMIETGVYTDSGELVWGSRVIEGLFGDTGDVNFTDNPGYENIPGTFASGFPLGLTIRRALREWDGATFDAIASEPLILVKFLTQVPTPADDTPTPAFQFGAANGSGYFHSHIGYAFANSNAVEGLFLLEVELWSGDAANVVTEPLFVVFAQGAAAVGEQDDAVDWVESNLIGTACIADLAEPFGQLTFGDISAFLGAFSAQDPAADLAAPVGQFTFGDISAFLAAFSAGCP
jgi:hypothetical protein